MRKQVEVILAILIAGCFSYVTNASAVQYDIHSRTYLFAFQDERLDTTANLVPIYEFLSLSVQDPGVKGLSAHISLWGNLQTYDWWKDEKYDGDILYGYLKYSSPELGINARAGRIFVNAGGSALMEQMDGGYFSYSFRKGSKIEIYGGSQINERDGSRKGDWLVGFRGSHRWEGKAELGISYFYEVERNDVNFDRVGIDGWYYFGPKLNLNGYASYDITYGNVGDVNVNLAYYPGIGSWKLLNVEVGYRTISSFLGSQSVLSVFSWGNFVDTRVKATFVSGGWRIIPSYEPMIYIESKEHVHRISIKACRFFEEGRYFLILEASRLQLSDAVDYTELRGAVNAKLFSKISSSLDVVWDLFDKKVKYGDESTGYALDILASLDYEFREWLKVNVGIDIGNGIERDWQVKGMGKLEVLL